MADDSFSAQVWAAMNRAAQQVIDDLQARGRELDPSRIVARVVTLLSDVPGVREHVPALVEELQNRQRSGRLRRATPR